MKIYAIALAAALTLGGCNEVNQQQINQAISAVQQSARAICGFVPYANTIVNIFQANGGAFRSTLDVAQQICGAISVSASSYASSHGRVVRTPTLYGVPVQGTFVRTR